MSQVIDLIATGSQSPRSPELLQKASQFIGSIGYIPRSSPTIFGDHPIYANSDERRLRNLINALYAEDSEIIWCLRGGCGTTRLIPHLYKLQKPAKPKMVIGLSDVTALLLFLSQEWGWQVVHGPTAHFAGLNLLTRDARDMLVALIKGELKELVFDALVPLNPPAHQEHVLEGLVTGGNLSLLEYSIGTSWQIQTQDRILFLEDINEAPYRLAERLEHLRQARLFESVKAILFGDFSHEDPQKQNPKLLDFVLKDFAEKTSIPCFKNFPVGHHADCRPIIINVPTLLTTGAQGRFKQRIPVLQP